MKFVAAFAFLAGLLLWIRVMFFGVRREREEQFHHRRWPLALAVLLLVSGAALYISARRNAVTATEWLAVSALGLLSATAAWWFVHRSASVPSTDPEDDPRFRFQGHVARITEQITRTGMGRIAFDFDGRRREFRAQWTPAAALPEQADALGAAGAEVVIETVDGDLALVEPWVLVEERL